MSNTSSSVYKELGIEWTTKGEWMGMLNTPLEMKLIPNKLT